MQIGKAAIGQAAKQNDPIGETEFGKLTAILDTLTVDERGTQAVEISSRLLEYAAFELAGTACSRVIGELVETSARMSALAMQLSDSPSTGQDKKRAIQ